MGYLNEDGLATLVGKVKGQVVQLTAAEYRQIPAETKNTDNKIYFVEDDDYAYAIDNEPTLNSENLVKSGGVYNYTSKIGTGALTTTAQTIIPAVNELKAAVDTNTSDIAELNNGLTNLTTIETYSFTAMGTKIIYVYKMGRVVFIDSPYDATSATSGTNIIGTLPEKYRPIRLMRSPIANYTNSSWFAQIETDGKMMVYVNREITSATNMAFSFMYFSAS